MIGPWCWIGNDNKLRAHEGQLTLGAKVVMGRDNVVNTYLDIEIGGASILADWIYICDFDHRTERLDVPIKDQGIVKSPVRVGGDVWIGEKATVLRGCDIGQRVRGRVALPGEPRRPAVLDRGRGPGPRGQVAAAGRDGPRGGAALVARGLPDPRRPDRLIA